jgi:hypothetical protein
MINFKYVVRRWALHVACIRQRIPTKVEPKHDF